ncbi:MFS transporter [Gilliamella apicola]|uniref:MFS transporter n=1 Tax=unclassified Gilliamella TaxID=2685620 RepID=UPI0011466C88
MFCKTTIYYVYIGFMYVKIGFERSYLVFGFIAFSFTRISSFTLSVRGPWDLWKQKNSEQSELWQILSVIITLD